MSAEAFMLVLMACVAVGLVVGGLVALFGPDWLREL